MWGRNGFVHAIPQDAVYAEHPIPVVVGPPGPGLVQERYPRHPPIYHPVPLERRPTHTGERRSRSAGRRHRSPQRQKSTKHVDPLKQWSEWRTGVVNGGLARDLVNHTYREIPIGEDFDNLVRPPRRSRHGVYHYSTAVDQATQLQKEDFVNFGIPRAQVTGNSKASRRHSPSRSSSSGSESEAPFYSIQKLANGSRLDGIHKLSDPAYDRRNRYSGEDSDGLMVRERRDHSRGRQYRPLSPDVQVLRDGRYRSHR